MKKLLVVLLILGAALTLSADPLGSGTLNVYGLIPSGDIDFVVSQVTVGGVTPRIDLVNNLAVQPSGDGVVIGSWTFSATNQALSAGYAVSYTYGVMSSGAGENLVEIAYEVVEIDGEDAVVKATGASTSFTATPGDFTEGRNLAVRLTEAGATRVSTAPARNNYNSVITVELTAN